MVPLKLKPAQAELGRGTQFESLAREGQCQQGLLLEFVRFSGAG
jgi:hypothetical protein